jgi:hypothetical protein
MHAIRSGSAANGSDAQARSHRATTGIQAKAGVTWAIQGFAPMTPIETEFGPFPAQTLRERDRVRVRSGLFRPILRVERLVLDEDFLDRNPDAQAVQVGADALGRGFPTAAILVSPAQVLSGSHGPSATPREARDLLVGGRAHRRPERLLTYTVLSFGEPVEVRSEGLWLLVPG